MAKNYYYLIAGLPDISFDDSKKQIDFSAFKAELENNLASEDFGLIKYFFYKFDNQNLLNHINKNEDFNKLGIFSLEGLDEEIKRVKDEGPDGKGAFPQYMQDFIHQHLNESFENTELSKENQLAMLYFEEAIDLKNKFISNYYGFELNMLNFLTASISRKHDLEYENEIIGENEIAQQIKKSNAKDFNLGSDFEFTNNLFQIIDIKDIKERERKTDQLRWNYLENEVFFHYFTVERIFAYLIKLEIIERWTDMSYEKGKQKFEEIMENMQSTYEFPKEYVKK